MQPIIRQNQEAPRLPDFRNLGTVLRVLLAVNAIAAIGVLVMEPRWELWPATWFDSLAYVEPYLLSEILLLYALSPVLARAPYVTGAGTVVGLTLLVGVAIDLLFGRVAPIPAIGLLRHVLLAMLLCCVLLGYFHLRAKALSPAITEARLQALQARIRPHFLFNSINAVLSLMRPDPKRAEEALEDLADLFRVLMRDNRDLGPLANEVELCRQYLHLEQLRLGDRLQIEWHLNSMPGDALVPPLVLQPLIENAVYHGIEPLSAPGVISINIFCKGGEVHAIVRNPYRVAGGRHHGGNKMALGNVRERLALHFDAEAALTSRVKADEYEVHIRMPYRVAKSAGSAPIQDKAAGPSGASSSSSGSAIERTRGRPARAHPHGALRRPETSHG